MREKHHDARFGITLCVFGHNKKRSGEKTTMRTNDKMVLYRIKLFTKYHHVQRAITSQVT